MAHGIIYILINPAFKDLLKIGKTTRTAEERAAEISAGTGVPSKFVVAYEDSVADCDLAERRIFKALERHRYGSNREFFSLKLKDAIPVVTKIINQVNAEFEELRVVEEQRRSAEQRKKDEVQRREAEASSRASRQHEDRVQERTVGERSGPEKQAGSKEHLGAEKQLSYEERKSLRLYGVAVTEHELLTKNQSYRLNEITFIDIETVRFKHSNTAKLFLAPFYISLGILVYGVIAALISSESAIVRQDTPSFLLGSGLILLFVGGIIWALTEATRPIPIRTLKFRYANQDVTVPFKANNKYVKSLLLDLKISNE